MPSSGPDEVEQTQTAQPWAPSVPFAKNALNRAKNVTNLPFNFYNGDTIAPFSPEQQLGFGMATQRALAGSPTLDAANTGLTATLRGDYMSPDSNPWLKGTVDQAMGDVQGRINSQFNNSNFGSTAHQETLQRGLGQVANDIYGGNYQAERGRQLGATSLAPTLANADYQDAQMLQNVGAQRQLQSQRSLDQIAQTFGMATQHPYDQLQRYISSVAPFTGIGGTTTATGPNPNQSNGLANVLGTGLSLAGLFF